ncbi:MULTISPECIES: LysR family transcriptional regulator [unclassified Pseudomonas]|uniref:LysR family transcriptional regulator n=1 Tax=unclassified Pseudomonas TaxID=196821 RepID=UPI00158C6DEB|nr:MULTISPECIES: LysR family transcriptional regulator [unclassified Pseudomonas]MCU1735424.1 LysR family transcriptional regulator [Pseudomonas sp. 20P_3.2_Bac4]MCU1742652.1 LysR family transcriptional regulator [Pseudomonas sp. 20P_3.2_Bac5]
MLRTVTDLDLRLLRIFTTVVKCGGFTAAQAELNMSQSNISMHIGSLEKRLGYRLCERGKGGFRLTAKGKRILDASQAMFDAIGLFRDEAQALSGNLVGDLYVGLADNVATLPQARFGEALATFYQREQDVQLNLYVNSPTELELAVIDGQLDLAVSYFSRSRPSLDYLPLYTEEIGVFCGDRHPLFDEAEPALERIAACNWISHGFLPENQDLPLRPERSRATAYHMEAVAHAVLAGTHLGYLPTHYAQIWIERGRMRALQPERLRYEVVHSMITYTGRPRSEAARAFIEDLLAVHGLGI